MHHHARRDQRRRRGIDLASSFHCGGNLDAKAAATCQMLRTTYKSENGGPLDSTNTGLDPAACGLN